MSNKDEGSVASHLIAARKSGSQTSVMGLVRTNPELVAQIVKLTTPVIPSLHDGKGDRLITPPRQSDFQNISASVSQKDSDAETLMQLFPEIKLSSEIFIASIISPNDMFTQELGFSCDDGLLCQPLAGNLIPLVRAYFHDKHNLLAELPKILKESLFGSGSYAVAVIPESSVDDLINGKAVISKETLSHVMEQNGRFHPVGYLGSGTTPVTGSSFSTEAFVAGERFNKTNVTPRSISVKRENGTQLVLESLFVTDNPDALKMPGIVARQRKEAEMTLRNKRFGIGLERGGSEKMSDRDLTSLLYRHTRRKDAPLVKIKTGNEISRYTVGMPLIMKLPSESVIPVFPPGNPEKLVGAFIVVDAEGNAISRKSNHDHFEGLRNFGKQNKSNGDMSSFLIEKASQAFNGKTDDVTFFQAAQVYGDIVEADLMAKLRTGIYDSELSISNNQEIYRLMLARTLAKQHTQLLFIPAEMLSYFAYQFNDNGTGKSLLEDTRILSAMRAQMLFARVMAAVKNSIGRTKVRVEMDEDDPDAHGTSELVMAEVLNARQHVSPASSINPADILNQVQTMGIEFEFAGGAGMPNTKIEFSEHNTQYQKPDEELEEDLRKRVISGIGIPPELIDDAARPEFATTAISNNLLLAKRVKQVQEIYVALLSVYARQILLADGRFMIELKKVITANLKSVVEVEKVDPEITELNENPQLLVHMLAMEFLSNFNVTLAQPDIKSLENQKTALELHDSLYDQIIKYFISTDALDASIIGEEASNKLSGLAGAAKAAYMRRFLAANGIMPEIFELTATDDNGKPAFDVKEELTKHTESIALSLLGVLRKTTTVASAADLEISKLGGDEAGGGGLGTTDSSSETTDDPLTDGGGGDDTGDTSGGGGDDFDFPDMP